MKKLIRIYGKVHVHPTITGKKSHLSASTTGATGTTIAQMRATKKIARKLAQAASSTATMGSASRAAFAVTKTTIAAMAVMKKGKQIKIKRPSFNFDLICI